MPREYAVVQVLGSGPDAFIMHPAAGSCRLRVAIRNTWPQAPGPVPPAAIRSVIDQAGIEHGGSSSWARSSQSSSTPSGTWWRSASRSDAVGVMVGCNEKGPAWGPSVR